MPRYFEGQYLITPQAAVNINDSALSNPTTGGSGALCLIGVSLGGKPFTPQVFNNPQDAISALIGGDGLRAALRAFAPSPSFPGAPQVIFIRANNATQAAATLLDGSGAGSIVLTSSDYGSRNNLIKVQINAGSTSGRKITINNGPAAVVKDNITRSGLQVKYAGTHTVTATVGPASNSTTTTVVGGTPVVGSGTAQSILVGSSAGFAVGQSVLIDYQGSALAEVVAITAIVDSTHISGIFVNNHAAAVPIALYNSQKGLALHSVNAGVDVPAEDLLLTFDQYLTIQSLADAINAKTGIYTATVLTPASNDPSTGLDGVLTAPAVTSGGLTLTMDLYAVLLALNTGTQPWLTAAAATAATKPPVIEALGVVHYLTGAVDGNVPPLVTDWQSAFTAAATIDCSVVCVATGDATIHAMLQTHVDVESAMQERHERICVIGGVAGETVAQATARVAALRDPRLGLVYPGVLDIDATQASLGVITLDPWLVAAQLGGMFCGGRIQDALTNRFIRAQGVEYTITSSDRDNLQVSGIIPIQFVPNRGYRVVHSVSSWTADANYRRQELSVMRASDFLAKTVRTACDALVGQIVSPSLLLGAKQVTTTVLNDLWKQGVIVGDSTHPAFTNLQVSAAGDTVNIAFQAAIAIPANYILIEANLQPYSGSITV